MKYNKFLNFYLSFVCNCTGTIEQKEMYGIKVGAYGTKNYPYETFMCLCIKFSDSS